MRNHLIASTVLAAGWKGQACPQTKNQHFSLLLTSGNKLPQEHRARVTKAKVFCWVEGVTSQHTESDGKSFVPTRTKEHLPSQTSQNRTPPPPAMFSQKSWKESDAGTQCLGHGAEVVCPYVSSRRKGWINEDTITRHPGWLLGWCKFF